MWQKQFFAPGEQRADGLFGAVIIRSRTPPTLYDLDEHVIIINEWTEISGMSSYVLEHQNGYPQMPHTILVNGLGPRSHPRYRRVPKPVFNVRKVSLLQKKKWWSIEWIGFGFKGKRYRFRLINVGAQNCPIMVSVDNHTMLAVSVDGADIKPIEGTSKKSVNSGRLFKSNYSETTIIWSWSPNPWISYIDYYIKSPR